jgi:hypothetical protein
MKNRTFLSSVVSTLLLLAFSASFSSNAFGDDALTMLRADAQTAFLRLTANNTDAMKEALKTRGKSTASTKFRIAKVNDPTLTVDENEDNEQNEDQLAVKIWFTLANGVKINPVKHKWSPREKFYVHVEAAAPVYVSLFHDSPNGENGNKSTLVYPDSRYSHSAEVIQAGRATRLPVLFEMDDNTEEETMSMVVVRADWPGIQNHLTSQAVASVSSDNGVLRVNAQLTESGRGVFKCLNARAASTKTLKNEEIKELVQGATDKEAQTIAKHANSLGSPKFRIVEPGVSESNEVDEVCFIMFSSQQVGQWQLKMNK